MLEAMVRHATDDEPVASQERERWLAASREVQAVGQCACGSCPSIDLGPDREVEHRVVLTASVEGALVLLFVDDYQPSYLELAPLADEVFTEFPPAEALRF